MYERFGNQLKIDPWRRCDILFRVQRTIKKLNEVNELNIIEDVSPWFKIVESFHHFAFESEPSITHGDFYFRHILLNKQKKLSGIIDWGDLQINDPSLDLLILWSFFNPSERETFIKYYGEISSKQHELSRLFAIFLSAVLVSYGYQTKQDEITKEAIHELKNILLE